jgi:hypothetical protein
MNMLKWTAAGVVVAALVACSASSAQAYGGYYSGYQYYPSRGYYASYYYYKPYRTYPSYYHHYCVYYPSTPRYVYYYNPYRRTYWGRYDLEEKGYSMLAEKDRRERLAEIPESAFPKPGEMPAEPDSTDGSKLLPPPAPPKDAKAGAQ